MKIDTKKIMVLLAEKGLSKSEFAKCSGISRQNISIIIGRGTCTPQTAHKLAHGLNVSVKEIIEEE